MLARSVLQEEAYIIDTLKTKSPIVSQCKQISIYLFTNHYDFQNLTENFICLNHTKFKYQFQTDQFQISKH
jgi:hypothetical protein